MFTAMQIILILLWFTGYDVYSKLFGGFTAGGCVLHGVVVGTIMGNMEVGLFIGGTYELMNIGLNPLGGSTVPDYNMGTVIGTAFGAISGAETGMAVGIVVATLSTTLDVFGKTAGSFFLHKAQACFEAHEFKKGYNWIHIGLAPLTLLKVTIPTIIVLVAGSALVAGITEAIPVWLLQGFKNAGNILPCLGFAILLHQLQVKGNFQYLLIGFFCFAYLGVNALGTALVGLALALLAFNQQNKFAVLEKALGGDDDE